LVWEIYKFFEVAGVEKYSIRNQGKDLDMQDDQDPFPGLNGLANDYSRWGEAPHSRPPGGEAVYSSQPAL
jgi:hypothetical protein